MNVSILTHNKEGVLEPIVNSNSYLFKTENLILVLRQEIELLRVALRQAEERLKVYKKRITNLTKQLSLK